MMNWLCSEEFLNDQAEALVVGFVQRRIHFVEDAEWAGLALKMLMSRAMQVIAFSPPESWLMRNRLLARRTGDHLDACVQRIDLAA